MISERISAFSKYLFFVCLIVIVVFSVLPEFSVEDYEVDEGFTIRMDYVLHFLAYAMLSLFFLVWKRKNGVSALVAILLIGISSGLILEFQQNYIVGRTFNPVDAYLNAGGTVFGAVFVVYLLGRIDEF